MRTAITAAAVALAFILSGCGAAAESEAPAPTAPAAATPTATADPDKEAETKVCDFLSGVNSDYERPLIDAVTTMDDALGDGAKSLDVDMAVMNLKVAGGWANDDMKPLLEDLAAPLKVLQDSEGSSNVQTDFFDEAALELSEICGIELPVSVAAPQETPTPVETSGDYGADLAAAGTVPDNVDSYGEFMSEYLCDSELQGTGFGTLSNNVRRFGEPGDEASGYGPAAVRLTVAYYCPERADAAEEALAEHGYDS